jgi:hypothetical protein
LAAVNLDDKPPLNFEICKHRGQVLNVKYGLRRRLQIYNLRPVASHLTADSKNARSDEEPPGEPTNSDDNDKQR